MTVLKVAITSNPVGYKAVLYESFGPLKCSLVPVLVWFSGGGYIFGSKHLFGSPAGLFHESRYADKESDFIYVCIVQKVVAHSCPSNTLLLRSRSIIDSAPLAS